MTTIALKQRRPADGAFARIAELFSDWAETRKARAALRALSDRELDDIGISRSDIDYVTARR